MTHTAENDAPCQHARTHMVASVVGTGIHRHMVRRETCDDCGEVVALW